MWCTHLRRPPAVPPPVPPPLRARDLPSASKRTMLLLGTLQKVAAEIGAALQSQPPLLHGVFKGVCSKPPASVPFVWSQSQRCQPARHRGGQIDRRRERHVGEATPQTGNWVGWWNGRLCNHSGRKESQK